MYSQENEQEHERLDALRENQMPAVEKGVSPGVPSPAPVPVPHPLRNPESILQALSSMESQEKAPDLLNAVLNKYPWALAELLLSPLQVLSQSIPPKAYASLCRARGEAYYPIAAGWISGELSGAAGSAAVLRAVCSGRGPDRGPKEIKAALRAAWMASRVSHESFAAAIKKELNLESQYGEMVRSQISSARLHSITMNANRIHRVLAALASGAKCDKTAFADAWELFSRCFGLYPADMLVTLRKLMADQKARAAVVAVAKTVGSCLIERNCGREVLIELQGR